MVLDSPNAHQEAIPIEIFGTTEADRTLSRLHFYPTPLHASWLNMAKIGGLEAQCLDHRRLSHEFTLDTGGIAREGRRNQQQAKIHWTFA